MSQSFQPPAPESQMPAHPATPPAAPPARSGNIGLGIAAAVIAALVAAGAYGGIIGATEREIGYAALAVGLIIGFATGKLGGPHPALPVVGAVLSLGAVYGGQALGTAIIGSKVLPLTVTELLTEHFDLVQASLKEDLSPISFLFYALGAVTAFQTARKVAA
ncbi:hypothetical protein DEJ50_19765 [Streptomyces venezuelae]|uniref:Uncharacterized protein n=1 Tax=Streptomyces venezuelae TaxID=54571 RepID=A0A5P2D4P7_STRVZ|nr:hypothetical protein [Streptomyces venezuelae]QES49713.1 hypothetical protein DEJ50_19765 [Streptomyces venezuelae]